MGQELIRRSCRKVLFTTCSLLVQELLKAKRELELPKLLKRLSRVEALIVDEMGYVQQSREEMEVLFTLLAERYERGQRAADEQPAVLEVGDDLQGRDDDGGGDRPAGASQRDLGVEPVQLSPGDRQAFASVEEGGRDGAAVTHEHPNGPELGCIRIVDPAIVPEPPTRPPSGRRGSWGRACSATLRKPSPNQGILIVAKGENRLSPNSSFFSIPEIMDDTNATSSAYTPGPWVFDQATLDVDHLNGTGITEIYLQYGEDHRDEPQTRANGFLIAAAPDLMRELTHLLNCCELNLDEIEESTVERIKQADAAIAKAEGCPIAQS